MLTRRFRDAVLEERTGALARRGLDPDRDRLPPRLLCVAASRRVALPIGMIASIRPFGCHPVPLIGPDAARAMLGLAVAGRSLVSVLDLGRLLELGEAGAERPSGGSMLLLRDTQTPTALRVDRVLGVARLLPTAEPDCALLPPEELPLSDAADAEPPLVTLLDAATLFASIARLDHA